MESKVANSKLDSKPAQWQEAKGNNCQEKCDFNVVDAKAIDMNEQELRILDFRLDRQ